MQKVSQMTDPQTSGIIDVNTDDREALLARIHQVEREREELRKDIEQLCIQQAGPAYLAVATKMHFQRTAGLEQEIESLRRKLASCTKENSNLQEELSEAYRIKTQVADLHRRETIKNLEAEKQVKFFQNCVASAFAERDHSLMEAEKAKEKEEFMSRTYNELQQRLEDAKSDFLEQKQRSDDLNVEMVKLQDEFSRFRSVIEKFYKIRQQSLNEYEDASFDEQCSALADDPETLWRFNDDSIEKNIRALEANLDESRNTIKSLRSRLQMGLDIENHLQNQIREIKKNQVRNYREIINSVQELRLQHIQFKTNISSVIKEEMSFITKAAENITQPSQTTSEIFDKSSISHALTQAMEEKVGALLLLSQEEERHLLERNINSALQNKLDDLHRTLLQVTNEKVKALMELAQLKQDYKQLQQNQTNRTESKHETEGRLKSILKGTYMKRWISENPTKSDAGTNKTPPNLIDLASLKIENAALKESLESIKHLTFSMQRLRTSLLKAKESDESGKTVDDIIGEAKLMMTALGSSLPLSWHADEGGECNSDDVDYVYGVGFEMVELFIVAARALQGTLVLPSNDLSFVHTSDG